MTEDWRDLDAKLLSSRPEPRGWDVQSGWMRVRARMTVGHRAPRRAPALWLAFTAAAVLLLALVGRSWISGRDTLEVRTVAGERRTLRLDDGSTLVLAPATRVRYQSHDQTTRAVDLQGEAWFEVATDSTQPFVVRAGRHEVTVLGTSFGIRSDAGRDSVRVVVTTGRVAFGRRAAPLGETVVLGPGQGAMAAPDAAPRPLEAAEVESARSWMDGALRFRAAPLGHVIAELERWFALDVVLTDPALAQQPLTADFGLDSADLALEAIAVALDLTVESQGRRVTLSRRAGGP